MGLPEIFISFETAAVTAISRSARGALAVVLSDATEGGAARTRKRHRTHGPPRTSAPTTAPHGNPADTAHGRLPPWVRAE